MAFKWSAYIREQASTSIPKRDFVLLHQNNQKNKKNKTGNLWHTHAEMSSSFTRKNSVVIQNMLKTHFKTAFSIRLICAAAHFANIARVNALSSLARSPYWLCCWWSRYNGCTNTLFRYYTNLYIPTHITHSRRTD